MIPFKTETVMDACTRRRVEETRRFIGVVDSCVGDVGEPNQVVGELVEFYQSINHTDFNREVKPDMKYEVVFCFEVLEHLMNPLLFMEQIYKKCVKKGGVVYLSTPVANRFGFMFNEKEHFVELRLDKLIILFEYAGFKVEKVRTFKTIPFWSEIFNGFGVFRKLLRIWSTETALFKLRKV